MPREPDRLKRCLRAPRSVSETSRARMLITPVSATLFVFLLCLPLYAQRERGELHIEARDPQSAAVAAVAVLESDASQFHRTFTLAADGTATARSLPYGIYSVRLTAAGFEPWTRTVQVASSVPLHVTATLKLATVSTQIEVNSSATLVDPQHTSSEYGVGERSIRETLSPFPSREVSDLVNSLPGWLYEANGVLHPRGSEYDVLYVADGVPVTQNHSPAFSPATQADDIESLRVLTAGYPAEYGRKLGGVVEVTTREDAHPGWHGAFDATGGTFGAVTGSALISFATKTEQLSASAHGFHSDRFLDPPILQNYTNRGNGAGYSASYGHTFGSRDRASLSLSHGETRLLVPNELVQQLAGQRQDATNQETSGQIYFQHAASANLLWTLAGNVRDASQTLSSNALATPVIVSQDRGYREGYARTDVAGHHGRHDWKIGVDTLLATVHERLSYRITDPTQFDPGTELQFAFADRRWSIEPAAYVQDHIHLGNWNLSAGLRFDHYRFVVHEAAWSPRVSASRFFPSLNILVHAAYDRAFQTPAVENLLLASSPLLNSLNPQVVRLPVRPSRGNFYEVGFTESFAGKLRVDGNLFRRDFTNYSDDDVLLDTGVSFPISFASARIIGEEVRLSVPHWGRYSGFASYSNQVGVGRGPITGGLFLGSDTNGIGDAASFPVSQDQRSTLRAQVRADLPWKSWIAFGGQYGSGLPAETGGADPGFLLAQYGPEILARVNLERGRVRPNAAFDLSAGIEAYRHEQQSVSFQVSAANLADRVNVLNFASLFSGTAVAAPRSAAIRMRVSF